MGRDCEEEEQSGKVDRMFQVHHGFWVWYSRRGNHLSQSLFVRLSGDIALPEFYLIHGDVVLLRTSSTAAIHDFGF